MTSYVPGNLSSLEGFRSHLAALVRNFDRDATGNRKLIRELVENDCESFYCGAVEVLKQADDSRGSQYVVALLVAYDLLLRALCDREFTREQSLQLARAAATVDPMVDVALAKRLADDASSLESSLSADEAGRVMEALSAISDGSRIQPSMMRLMRHSNPYVRSKAVKLVGRGSGSVKWVRTRLAESDPRIRANAVEALWGVDTEDVRELLHTAALDGNNRVAGNALLALYRLGDCTSIPEVVRMSDHGSALFRSSAAWVMGETGDPRFTEVLARLLREPNTAVRARAMSALGKIKRTVAQARQAPQWLASGLLLECDPQKPARRLQLALTTEGSGEHRRVLPTHILLSEDGRHVIQYKMMERIEPEAISAIFVFPRSSAPGDCAFTRGALKCLSWKRPSDLWAIKGYVTESSGGEVGEQVADTSPRYLVNREAIEAALNSSPKRSECAPLWNSLWQAVRADQAPARGRRHLILFSDSESERAAGNGLVSAVLASRAIVQMISTKPNARLEQFCSDVRGSFRIAESEEAIAEAISMAYLNLLARYEISYQSACPEARDLRIRVNSPSGWAETHLALPGQAQLV